MANVTADSLHLLSIDLQSAPSSLRAVLELGSDDVAHWLKRAQAAGAPLAIVCSPDCVDLYSSEAGRRAAFKPLLESLWSLGRNLEGFEQIKTREGYGYSVVRHLLRQAAGLESTEHGRSYSRCIAVARAQAAHYGTLSPALIELFQLASSTAHRSAAETELSAPYSTRASRQIEALGAERILEEELTAYRIASEGDARGHSSVPAPRGSLLPGASSYPPYSGCEPGSSTRLRVAPFSLVSGPLKKSG